MANSEKPKILIVDDLSTNITVLEGILKDLNATTVSARSGNEALSCMLDNDFALVLMDVQMPEMDGFETAELMRGSAKTKHIPIIFVTAISKSPENIFRGYEAGAVDYIFKPFNPHTLKGKVKIFLEQYNQRKALEITNEELRDANRKILDQQRSIIEEERLKVLLQLSGATAHELNQPLMGLLGTVDLIKMEKNPDTILEYVGKIEEATNRISGIVQKIQTIRYDDVIPYSRGVSIINIEQKINILVVEEADDDFELINNILTESNNININRVKSIEETFSIMKKKQLDLMLLDYYLPDGNAFEMLERMKEEQCEIPAVIITGKGNEVIASKIIQAGAYDYLPKDSLNSNSLSRTIMNTLEKAQLKRQVKEAYNRMVDMSVRDELTGLYNRRYFIDAIETEMARSQRYRTALVLCIFDIDHFKVVNDTHGHLAGDKVLSKIGNLLKESIRDNDIACRYGGEEFAVLLPHTNIEEAGVMCERFRELVESYDFTYNSVHMNITVSIGIAQYKSDKKCDRGIIIEQADKALYQAKEEGRNRTIVFDSDIE